MHSVPALLQLEHGCLLSHRTLRFLQVVQDLGFTGGAGGPLGGGEVLLWRDALFGAEWLLLLVLVLRKGFAGDVVEAGLIAKSSSI